MPRAAEPPLWCLDCEEAGRALTRPVVTGEVKVGTRMVAATGKRCHTDEVEHHKAKRRHRAARRHGLDAEASRRTLLFQRGVCFFCRRATGRTKALAVDHDHRHCPGAYGCRDCIRGRLCGPCNQWWGWIGEDLTVVERVLWYGQHGGIAKYALAVDEEGEYLYEPMLRDDKNFIPRPRKPMAAEPHTTGPGDVPPG